MGACDYTLYAPALHTLYQVGRRFCVGAAVIDSGNKVAVDVGGKA